MYSMVAGTEVRSESWVEVGRERRKCSLDGIGSDVNAVLMRQRQERSWTYELLQYNQIHDCNA
jgi:hypothetical protein